MMGTQGTQRRLSGGASVKLLVWVVVFFGAYSAFKLMGVNSVETTIERAVDEMLGKVKLDTSHDAIKHLIIRRVAVASIDLDPESIQVETERRTGELRVEVEVAHPVTISFLGSERVLTADVHVTGAIPIDEAALARQAKHKRRQDEHWTEVREALSECTAKWGRGNCTLSDVPGEEFGLVRDY